MLGLEDERALQRVVALEVEVDAELRVLGAIVGALPTNTGAPGTVEKTVSVSVVVAPDALL